MSVRRAGGLGLAAALLTAAALSAQPGGKIEISKMRPTGLLVDDYSYMTPPHNGYYFHNIDKLDFRIDRVRRGGPVHPLVDAPAAAPVIRYRFEDRDLALEDYFDRNHVTGFLVLRGDTVLVERYFHGADRKSRFVSQSVGKSIVSILVGVAVDEKMIASVDDPVTKYLPDLAGSGYRNVTVKNVLQMATGVDYSENYRDSTSGAARIGGALVAGRPTFSDFVRSMQPTAVAPGTTFNYQSVNTQLLGMLLDRVTRTPLPRWAGQKLWSRLGAEGDAFFYQAKKQPDTCAFACFNATLRDYGRVGRLMIGNGAIDGRRIVSESWVHQSVTPDAPYLQPAPAAQGRPPRFGYGYQWWIPPAPAGAFMAIGIFGQAVYVDPSRDLVIVQTSAWPTPIGNGQLDAERFTVFQAIGEAVARR